MNDDGNSQILEYLATFMFLSVSQFVLAGRSKSVKTLYRNLGSLGNPSHGLITARKFPPNPNIGSLEAMYYLTPRGRKHLIRNLKRQGKDINMPIGNSKFYKDYKHRKRTIDIHILLSQILDRNGFEIELYHQYFQGVQKKSEKGREGATKIETSNGYFRPDSICLVTEKGMPKRLLCVEIHNGYDVVRICKQLEQYVYALASGSPSIKYNVGFSALVIVVFEEESTMHSTMERVGPNPLFHHMKEYFLCKTYASFVIDPLGKRSDLSGRSHSII